jgi:hypothetical protein
MRDEQTNHLGREIEQARSRVASDLARLRDPNAMSDLKRDISYEVTAAKNRLTQSARDAASAKVSGVFDGIKERIAANPVAAAAIVSGIAWRLVKHPPVATVLVGAGLVSLFRTDPNHPTAAAGWVERASKTAVSARRRFDEWDPQQTQNAIGETFDSAKARVVDWSAEAAETGRDAANHAVATARRGGDALRRMSHNIDDRDKMLFGAAALAIAAAVGIAYQRRSGNGVHQRVQSGAVTIGHSDRRGVARAQH